MCNELSFDRDSIRELQTGLLKQTVEYCRTASPHYRELLRGVEIRDIEDIRSLPFTSKETLCGDSGRFLCVPDEQVVEIVTTSGSTGNPLVFKMTENDLERLTMNEYFCFTESGITARDTVILAVTLDKCFVAGLAYYLGLRRIGSSVLRIGPTSPEMLLRLALTTKATAIVGVPSYLVRVAGYARESGIALSELGIRKLVCIGEPVRNRDFSFNESGRKLHELWQAEIMSTYGITELAISFCECPKGNGGHLHPGLLHVEIVDDNGNVLPPGQEGEVVATTFGVTGMPLLRYRTGDISFLIDEPCACGLRTPRLGPIVGRKNHKLKIKGTTVYPQAIINAMEGIRGVAAYAIVATSDADLSDQIEIKVSLAGDCTVKDIKERLKGSLKVTPLVTPDTPAAIDALRSSVSVRKKTAFIDRR